MQRRDRRDELLGLTPGDAASAVWTFEATAVPAPPGTDIRARIFRYPREDGTGRAEARPVPFRRLAIPPAQLDWLV